MTVTHPQAQMLAELARACRPTGARRWDTAGIMAAIKQVADRDLATVVMAVIRAASDRDVDSPGVIPGPGSHWRESAAARSFVPEQIDNAGRCSICYESQPRCRARWSGDHDFQSVTAAAAARLARKAESVHRTVAALKDELAPTAPPPEPTGLDALTERRPELAAAADAIAAACPGLRQLEAVEA